MLAGPGKVENVQLQRTSYNNILVTWDQPGNSQYVQSYRIHYIPNLLVDDFIDAFRMDVEAPATSAVIEYADPSFRYGVKVEARSWTGEYGELSDTVISGLYTTTRKGFIFLILPFHTQIARMLGST